MSVADIMSQIDIVGRDVRPAVDPQQVFNAAMPYRHYADGLNLPHGIG